MDDYQPIDPVPTPWSLNFLFFLAVILTVGLAKQNPLTATTLSIGMIVAGLPLMIYGVIKARQYKDILDYEPTSFWRRKSNGKRVRTFLMTCDFIGLYCLLVGVVLLFDIFTSTK
jgi:hypothetical protein